MATLTVLPSPLPTLRGPSRNGIKRRYRSPSPESETPEKGSLNGEEWEVGSRPRKTRKLRERPLATLAIPALQHVLPEPPLFNAATDMEDVDNQGPASISPAAFAEAMDGVLTNSDIPYLPINTISPPFIPQTISSGPSIHDFKFGTNNQPDWWFPTGDLVLGVENMMFRVHKRVLAQHSVVFEDMFALSEPSSDCDIVEDVPSVQLHDAAADWMETLSWLYNGRPSYDAQSLGTTVTFRTIQSHLRISNKYDMPTLRRLSQAALEHTYPADLVSRFCNPLPNDAAPVINAPYALLLAHQCDVPKVLPAALYHLLTSHNIDHSTSSLHPPLNLQKGYSALQSVASSLCTSLSIPPIMFPPELLPGEPRPFQALLRTEFFGGQLFGHHRCFDIIQRRWLATLARYTVNRIVSPGSNTGPPDVPLLEALRELEKRISNNNEVIGGHPCENCYWVERRLMRRMIGTVLAALPWWFGL